MVKTPRTKRSQHDPSRRKERGLLVVGVSLPKIAAPALRKRGFAQTKLITNWPAIVGEMLARETLPQKLVFPRGNRGDGILHLRVSSGFALELQHIAPQLIERINDFFGYRAVADFRYQQGPIPPQGTSRKVQLRRLADADEAQLERSLIDIADPGLREALLGLGRAVRIGRKPK
ncbi:MAG: DciA family protein [Pseudomonadota bacterium]|nr:DciA family protein [Pseudomonadota bacterium]